MSQDVIQIARKKCFLQTKKELQKAVTQDQLIIQAHEMVRDLHKVTNLLAKRLREWSGGWIPELDKYVTDHEQFTYILANNEYAEILKELKIKESIGTQINETAQKRINKDAKRLLELFKERDDLQKYVEDQLKLFMPSTLELCGSSITAEMLTIAKSLQRLALFPSGTVQLLGAETALFRHLKNKKNRVPKHGVIFNHPLLQKARKSDRGKVARALADKIVIAARVDYFKGETCGKRLKKELEAKFA